MCFSKKLTTRFKFSFEQKFASSPRTLATSELRSNIACTSDAGDAQPPRRRRVLVLALRKTTYKSLSYSGTAVKYYSMGLRNSYMRTDRKEKKYSAVVAYT
jgi:hypothetical protein